MSYRVELTATQIAIITNALKACTWEGRSTQGEASFLIGELNDIAWRGNPDVNYNINCGRKPAKLIK